jgi:hypothetical protein
MMLYNQHNRRPGQVYRFLMAWAAAVLCALVSQPAAAQSDPIPEVVKKIQMGSSAATVIESIKGRGTYTTEELPKEHRSRLIWVGSESPYYKSISFTFTEKDRLYLVRFTLNDAAIPEYPNLKKAVFKDYDFSWDKPVKLKIKDQDISLYACEKGITLFFLEFADRKTHEKAFEIFDRAISASDRVYGKAGEHPEGAQPKPEEVKPSESDARPEKEPAQPAQGSATAPGSAPTEQQGSPKPDAPPPVSEEKKPEK